MQSHQTGAINGNRLGSVVVAHTARITTVDYGAIGNNDQKLIQIKASAANPVGLRPHIAVRVQGVNGANAYTAQLGTTQGGTEVIGASDLKTAAPAGFGATGTIRWFVADTDIWLRVINATTVPSAGESWVTLELFEGNVVKPTNQLS